MSHRREHHERLRHSEKQTILMPDIATIDLPMIPILWGAFDPVLLQENRRKLTGLGKHTLKTPAQRKAFDMLSDSSMELYAKHLNRFNQWTDVVDNFMDKVKVREHPDLARELQMDEFVSEFTRRLQQARGNVVLAGRQHSLMYPAHTALRKEMTHPERTKVAELVYDRHIDTIIKPDTHFGVVTSANVYNYLMMDNLLVAPVIFGPDNELTELFKKQGEHERVSKLLIMDMNNLNDPVRRRAVDSTLEQLRKWGVTHVTHTVDMDVLANIEGAFAVRYSPVVPYLGLGCQILPEMLTANDLEAVTHLRYPTPQVRYLLQANNIHASQNLQYVREFARADVDGIPMFTSGQMTTDLGTGRGMRLVDVLKTIAMFKEELPKYGIRDGILLKSGAVYKGAVVEMCGYEDEEKKTSKAAAQCQQAIAS